jgi:hypothetical protein
MLSAAAPCFAIAGPRLATTYTPILRFQRRMLPEAEGGNEQARQGMDVMADDTKHAPQHDKYISLEQDWEAEYWAKKFGVSRESLEEAVAVVGLSVANVGAYLHEDAVAHG